MPKKHHQGFIPLIGLITTAFLAVAVFIGTAIVSNKNTNLDLRGLANTQRADGQCLGPGESCTSGKSYFDNICTPTDERCGTKTVTTNPTTPTKIADGQCLGPGESCSSGKSYTDNSCTPTDERCGVKQEVETVLVDNGDCAPNNTTTKQYKCQNDKGYADTTCGGRNYRCGTKTSSKADGQCLGPGESCSSGKSYTDNSCTPTDERCGVKQEVETVLVDNGDCAPNNTTTKQYKCQNDKGYADTTCGGRNYRCGTKTSSKADGQCLGPGESCSSGKSYTDNSCTPTDERCGDKPVITTVSVANGACLGLATGIQYVCQSGIGYGDSTCGGRNYRCGDRPSSSSTVSITQASGSVEERICAYNGQSYMIAITSGSTTTYTNESCDPQTTALAVDYTGTCGPGQGYWEYLTGINPACAPESSKTPPGPIETFLMNTAPEDPTLLLASLYAHQTLLGFGKATTTLSQISTAGYIYGTNALATAAQSIPAWAATLLELVGGVGGSYATLTQAHTCAQNPSAAGCDLFFVGAQLGWLDDIPQFGQSLLNRGNRLVTNQLDNLAGSSLFNIKPIDSLDTASALNSMQETTTFYKGIQNFDPELGGILPGGLSSTANTTVKYGAYETGTGVAYQDLRAALDHALAGQTGSSAYGSWTPNLSTAQKYAGNQGVVVSTQRSQGEFMNLSKILSDLPEFGGSFTNPNFYNTWEELVNTEIKYSMVNEGVDLLTAKKNVLETLYKNARTIIEKSQEVLIPGVVTNFSIVQP